MNVLVISYSHTGTCRRVRRALGAQFNWIEGEITDLRGKRGHLRCVFDSLLRRAPAIQYAGPVPADFDAVVLVAPIWADRLAGPMRSFVRAFRDRLPPVLALVPVMSGSGGLQALAEVTATLGRAPDVFTTLTSLEVDTGEFERRRLRELSDRIAAAVGQRATPRPAEKRGLIARESAT